MKIIVIIAILFASHNISAQSIAMINKEIGISDSLSELEVRIYKMYQITTSVELFRLYQDSNKKWKAINYHLKTDTKLFDKTVLISEVDVDYIWNELTMEISHLPNLQKIRYKLRKSEIVKEDGKFMISRTTGYVMDGVAYTAQSRIGNEINTFSFNNYDVYLNEFPEVDELISYDNLIKTIRNRFKIWN